MLTQGFFGLQIRLHTKTSMDGWGTGCDDNCASFICNCHTWLSLPEFNSSRCHFGVHASVIIPTASELFGLKSLGMLYNTLFIASPLGSLLFSGVIAGFLYDRESRLAADEHHCTGAHCFRLTFIIMAGVCLVAIVLNILLVAGTRSLYQSLYGTRQMQPQGGDPLITSDNRG